jgi:CO/xanthine dehydrogenase FAD-binding subunit
MSLWKTYHTPQTIDEALRLLQRYGGNAQIVAGGTDLILDIQQGNREPVDALVDVTRIAGLDDIRIEGDWVVVGASVTHAQIERSELIRSHGMALAESCSVVGGPQVRNVATIGGNVAHALPAADGTIGLLALDAEAKICTLEVDEADKVMCEWYPLPALFAGPGRNSLHRNQMISAFRFRLSTPNESSAFDRIMRPQGVALPILGVAAKLALDEKRQRVIEAAIAIGPAGPVPFRSINAEAALLAAPAFSDEAVEAAIIAAQGEAGLRTSKYRASKEYRYEMVAVLLRRVLNRIRERQYLQS